MNTYDRINDILPRFPLCSVTFATRKTALSAPYRVYAHTYPGSRQKFSRTIPNGATDTEIIARLACLTSQVMEQRAKDQEEDAKRAESAAAETASRLRKVAAWKESLRRAKGGDPHTSLPDGKQYKALTERNLLNAGDFANIQVSLPQDLEKRAAFLAALDIFLQTL